MDGFHKTLYEIKRRYKKYEKNFSVSNVHTHLSNTTVTVAYLVPSLGAFFNRLDDICCPSVAHPRLAVCIKGHMISRQ